MTDAKLNSILDDGATDEESIDRLKEGESVVQKDLVTSLTDSIVDSIKSDGSSTPKPSKEVLKGSLSGLYSSDPEMARALEEVLDDPEVSRHARIAWTALMGTPPVRRILTFLLILFPIMMAAGNPVSPLTWML